MSLPFSASINYNNTIDERWTEKAEKERNRIELLRQIEENKHRKFMEKQKQQEIERRERIRYCLSMLKSLTSFACSGMKCTNSV